MSKNSWIRIQMWMTSIIMRSSLSRKHLWQNFHEDPISSFYMKLLTERQTRLRQAEISPKSITYLFLLQVTSSSTKISYSGPMMLKMRTVRKMPSHNVEFLNFSLYLWWPFAYFPQKRISCSLEACLAVCNVWCWLLLNCDL